MQSIDYEVKMEDLIGKLDRMTSASPLARRFAKLAYLAIVALAWTSAVLFYIKRGEFSRSYFLYGALALLITIGLPSAYRFYQNAFWKSVFTTRNLRGLCGPRRLAIDEDGVRETGAFTEVRARWADIARVENDAERIYLFVAPLLAIVIPGSAFKSEAEQDLLVADLRERVARARNTALIVTTG